VGDRLASAEDTAREFHLQHLATFVGGNPAVAASSELQQTAATCLLKASTVVQPLRWQGEGRKEGYECSVGP
jgi:hypothetical protein